MLVATLTQIAWCSQPIAHHDGKGETPLDDTGSCCCANLQVSFECPGTSLCGFHIEFDDSNFDPLCSVCLIPPGWSITQNADGSLDIDYSGPDCSGALGNGAPPIDFQFCGYNTPGQVGYTVTAYVCQQGGPEGGACVPGPEFCSRHFESTINCGTGPDAVTTSYVPFSVDAGFPNPATTSIRFDYSAPHGGMMGLTLVDILGKTVSASNHTIAQGDGNVTIGLAGAQPGAYYCVFELSGETVTKRIEVK